MIVCTSARSQEWFMDPYTDNAGLVVKIQDILYHTKTAYQDIKVATTSDLGVILLLNDLIYRTEIGGFAVPEMLAHVPMRTGDAKRKVLLIGGGDGYTQTEILKYRSVEQLDMVDIDEAVVQAARLHLSYSTRSFQDPRLRVHIADGYSFLAQSDETYDLILVTPTEAYDMTGNPGISFSLFQDEFYSMIRDHLTPRGMFVTDGGAAFYDFGSLNYATLTPRFRGVFGIAKPYVATAKAIPGHLFSVMIASRYHDPESDFGPGNSEIVQTRYYNLDVHRSSFALPQFMLDKMISAGAED